MTVPKWIAAALDDATRVQPFRGVDDDALAAALIERLPIEAMVRAAAFGPEVNTDIPAVLRVGAARRIVLDAVSALADGDADAVTLTALYQEASKVLDVAGVPYANNDEVPVPLDLAARIRWLAQQRPTRLDLQRVEAERDEAREDAAGLRRQLEELARHWLQRLEALALGAD